MILGIDATNISNGGGLTHLVELLGAATPKKYGFDQVIMWASQSILDNVYDKPWLKKCTHKFLEKNLFYRIIWQRNHLGEAARKQKCDLLFIPGGSFVTNFRPIVTMNQNLLPFEWSEIKRYGFSSFTLKWILLRYSQSKSFKKANAVIFLTRFSMNAVIKVIGSIKGEKIIIPHGLNPKFDSPPKDQYPISKYSYNNPFIIIYVSSLEPYKNNTTVIKAVSMLRQKGLPVHLDIYGRGGSRKIKKINKTINYYDKYNSIQYHGSIPQLELSLKYQNADLAINASSCETFGQTIIEGMAAGIPTVCSNKSAMPEILGDAGIYFDVNNLNEMVQVINNCIISPQLREQKGNMSYLIAKDYTWLKCANQTFKFFYMIANNIFDHKKGNIYEAI